MNKVGYKEKKEEICNNYFTFKGTEDELKEKLLTFMSEKDSYSFIHNIQKYEHFLGKGEFVKMTPFFSGSILHTMGFLVKSTDNNIDYNINISALTIVFLALLMDIKLRVGLASATLAILGFNNQAIVKIDVSEGEKCLILEANNRKNRTINENVFSKCNHQCMHKDLNCKYKDNENCSISKENIRKILDGLCAKNVFRKIDSNYKYNF